jgi:hypothetical protein
MQYAWRDRGRRFVWKQSPSCVTTATAGLQRSRSHSHSALVGWLLICATSIFVSSRRTLGHLVLAAAARWQGLRSPNAVGVRLAARTRPRQATVAARQARRSRGQGAPPRERNGQLRSRRPPVAGQSVSRKSLRTARADHRPTTEASTGAGRRGSAMAFSGRRLAHAKMDAERLGDSRDVGGGSPIELVFCSPSRGHVHPNRGLEAVESATVINVSIGADCAIRCHLLTEYSVVCVRGYEQDEDIGVTHGAGDCAAELNASVQCR